MRKRLRTALAWMALCALSGAACSEKLAARKGLSDGDLYERGRQMAEKKKYQDAIEPFQLLLERFPNSPFASAAQLGLADARAANKDFVEAESAYDDFLHLYPASDNVPYALFRKGELLFRQIAPPGRDQGKTQEALKTFTLLAEKHPASPYAASARQRIAALRDRLAAHEEVVVIHYLARKRYESAEIRARRALERYADTAAAPRLLARMAEALEKQGKKDEADKARRSLSEKFPNFGAKKK